MSDHRKYVVIVTGDRHAHYDDWALGMSLDFESRLNPDENDVILVHGAARGIDAIADRVWSTRWGRAKIMPYPAEWGIHGTAAGPKRNQAMLDAALRLQGDGYHPEVFAYHPNLGASKGTRHMVGIAQRAGIRVVHRAFPDSA